jgi:predicted nucleic acid-binding protein
LAAPDLIDVEVLSVLRRWERRGDITASRAGQALLVLQALPLIRYPARALLERAWKLRHNLTAYDAQYVALAQELPAKMLTTDGGDVGHHPVAGRRRDHAPADNPVPRRG